MNVPASGSAQNHAHAPFRTLTWQLIAMLIASWLVSMAMAFALEKFSIENGELILPFNALGNLLVTAFWAATSEEKKKWKIGLLLATWGSIGVAIKFFMTSPNTYYQLLHIELIILPACSLFWSFFFIARTFGGWKLRERTEHSQQHHRLRSQLGIRELIYLTTLCALMTFVARLATTSKGSQLLFRSELIDDAILWALVVGFLSIQCVPVFLGLLIRRNSWLMIAISIGMCIYTAKLEPLVLDREAAAYVGNHTIFYLVANLPMYLQTWCFGILARRLGLQYAKGRISRRNETPLAEGLRDATPDETCN